MACRGGFQTPWKNDAASIAFTNRASAMRLLTSCMRFAANPVRSTLQLKPFAS